MKMKKTKSKVKNTLKWWMKPQMELKLKKGKGSDVKPSIKFFLFLLKIIAYCENTSQGNLVLCDRVFLFGTADTGLVWFVIFQFADMYSLERVCWRVLIWFVFIFPCHKIKE